MSLLNSYINLANESLISADFEEAYLRNATLASAPANGMSLKNAILVDCDLRRIQLISADMRGAQLVRPDLRGANLSGARMDGSKILNPVVDETTVLPPTVTILWGDFPDVVRELPAVLEEQESPDVDDGSMYRPSSENRAVRLDGEGRIAKGIRYLLTKVIAAGSLPSEEVEALISAAPEGKPDHKAVLEAARSLGVLKLQLRTVEGSRLPTVVYVSTDMGNTLLANIAAGIPTKQRNMRYCDEQLFLTTYNRYSNMYRLLVHVLEHLADKPMCKNKLNELVNVSAANLGRALKNLQDIRAIKCSRNHAIGETGAWSYSTTARGSEILNMPFVQMIHALRGADSAPSTLQPEEYVDTARCSELESLIPGDLAPEDELLNTVFYEE